MGFLKLIWKRKIVIMISVFSVCLLGLTLSLIISPTYKATVEIAVQPTDVIYNFPQDTKAVLEYLRHQAQTIKSKDMVDYVIDKLHLKITDALDQRQPRESFLKHIKVETVGRSLIKITASAKTPQLAAAMASQLANAFLELHKDKSFSVSEGAMKWLSESSKLAKELKETQNKILQFIKENDMQNPEQQLEDYQQRADQLIKEKAQLLVEVEKNSESASQIEQFIKEKTVVEIITKRQDTLLADALADYRSQYREIQSETEQLLQTYKPDHPQIVELNRRRESIIKDVDAKINELAKESKNKVEYAKARVGEIDVEIEKLKKQYSELLEKKSEFDILNSKVASLSKLYEEAQGQLDTEGISIVTVSIVGFAGEGSAPVARARPVTNFLIIFGISGFIVGILMAFFIERSSLAKRAPKEPTENTEA